MNTGAKALMTGLMILTGSALNLRAAELGRMTSGDIATVNVAGTPLKAQAVVTPDSKATNADTEQRLLFKAILAADAEMLAMLLEKPELNINGRSKLDQTTEDSFNKGKSPLDIAVIYSNDMLKLLLARPDLQVNSRNYAGMTALMNAVLQGKVGAVTLLLTRGDIDVNAADAGGDTALMSNIMSIAVHGSHGPIMDLLLARNEIDVNAKNNEGDTALIIAAAVNNDGAVEKLLRHGGVEINVANNKGYTALSMAKVNHNDAMATLLLKYGAR